MSYPQGLQVVISVGFLREWWVGWYNNPLAPSLIHKIRGIIGSIRAEEYPPYQSTHAKAIAQQRWYLAQTLHVWRIHKGSS